MTVPAPVARRSPVPPRSQGAAEPVRASWPFSIGRPAAWLVSAAVEPAVAEAGAVVLLDFCEGSGVAAPVAVGLGEGAGVVGGLVAGGVVCGGVVGAVLLTLVWVKASGAPGLAVIFTGFGLRWYPAGALVSMAVYPVPVRVLTGRATWAVPSLPVVRVSVRPPLWG